MSKVMSKVTSKVMSKVMSKVPLTAKELRHARQVPISDHFVLVQVGAERQHVAVPATDSAGVLVGRLAAALEKGIDRSSVFRGPTPEKVYAYSVDPTDMSKVVRESFDGTRQIGTLSATGRFRAVTKT